MCSKSFRRLAEALATTMLAGGTLFLPPNLCSATPAPMAMLASNLFGAHTAFVAQATVENAPLAVPVRLGVSMCRFHDRVRLDFDLRQISQSAGLPIPSGLIQRLGVRRTVTLGRLSQPSAWRIVFPSLRSYYEEPLVVDDPWWLLLERGGRIETTVLGRETVDGHPCRKVKLEATLGSGRMPVGTAWYATDLKDFPVRIELLMQGQTTTVHLKNVTFGGVDNRYFDLPSDFQRHASLQSTLWNAVRGRGLWGSDKKSE